MKDTTWLAKIFDWIGDTLERFNPSAYKFLAALLPYLTPLPVAWLTAHSSATFLNFTPNIAFVFVFALEGIGLWFTALLVDAFVDWIRSRNMKTFSIVVLFGVAVSVYVYILVSLNVTLEAATGVSNPSLSKVITLLCFLPLITGIGNGYYKIKLDYKTQSERDLEYERNLAEKKRQDERADRLERYKIKHGANGSNERTMVTNEQVVRTVRPRTNTTNERTPKRTNGELRTFVWSLLEEYERTNRSVAGVSELARTIARTMNERKGVTNPDGSPSEQGYERYKGYCSEVRRDWISQHPNYQ